MRKNNIMKQNFVNTWRNYVNEQTAADVNAAAAEANAKIQAGQTPNLNATNPSTPQSVEPHEIEQLSPIAFNLWWKFRKKVNKQQMAQIVSQQAEGSIALYSYKGQLVIAGEDGTPYELLD